MWVFVCGSGVCVVCVCVVCMFVCVCAVYVCLHCVYVYCVCVCICCVCGVCAVFVYAVYVFVMCGMYVVCGMYVLCVCVCVCGMYVCCVHGVCFCSQSFPNTKHKGKNKPCLGFHLISPQADQRPKHTDSTVHLNQPASLSFLIALFFSYFFQEREEPDEPELDSGIDS